MSVIDNISLRAKPRTTTERKRPFSRPSWSLFHIILVVGAGLAAALVLLTPAYLLLRAASAGQTRPSTCCAAHLERFEQHLAAGRQRHPGRRRSGRAPGLADNRHRSARPSPMGSAGGAAPGDAQLRGRFCLRFYPHP
ncbi:MAG: hypothetical protein M5U34_14810 [Chloroflexi bacterium]|nr:hypothetical protein [Chloroflexota bacterium]